MNSPVHYALPKMAVAFLTAGILCATHTNLSAEPVSPQRAKALAGKYIKISPNAAGAKKAGSKTAADTPYYIFQGEGGHGYAIVSSDDALGEVLAYSSNGVLDTTVACPAKDFLDNYAEAYAAYKSGDMAAAKPARVKRFSQRIGPLLKTEWDQDGSYKSMLPDKPQYKYTGCGPTAMAQIMYFHRWPLQGKGSITYDNYGDTLSADFSKSFYDYDKMMAPKVTHVAPEESKKAVGLLMRDCGYASECHYTSSWSGSFEFDITKALNNHFDYTAVQYYRQTIGVNRFYDMAVGEISNGFPVIMSGGLGGDGHVYVADGVDVDGHVHFNFGWGGLNDGWYSFPFWDFRRGADAIFLHPNKPGSAPMPAYMRFGAPLIYFGGMGIMEVNGLNDNTSLARTDSVTVSMTEFRNNGQPFTGDMGIAIVDELGNGLDTIGSVYYNQGGFTHALLRDMALGTECSITNGTEVKVRVGLKNLAPGYYKLKAVCAPYSDSTKTYGSWYDVMAYPQVEIEVTADSIRLTEQGGSKRGWQLGGRPVWSKQRLTPGDNISLTLPIENLEGEENDGVLEAKLRDEKSGKTYNLGSASVTIDRYFNDSVAISGTVPRNCPAGVYALQLTMANGDSIETVKNLHNEVSPIYVTVGDGDGSAVIDENASAKTFSEGQGMTVILKRKFNHGAWNTLVLPFDLTAEQIKAVFGDDVKVAAYTGAVTDGSNDEAYTLNFKQVTSIAANVPVMIYGAKENPAGYTFTDVDIKDAEPAMDGNGFNFVGTYVSTTVPMGNFFINSRNEFYKAADERTLLKGTRATFAPVGSDASAAKSMNLSIDGTTFTAVGTIALPVADAKAPVYNLAGQRVGKAYKGIVIQNGKKFMQ